MHLVRQVRSQVHVKPNFLSIDHPGGCGLGWSASVAVTKCFVDTVDGGGELSSQLERFQLSCGGGRGVIEQLSWAEEV